MKYIIFDIDGTLTNTIKVDDRCYIKSFESIFNTSIQDVQWNQMTNVTDWGIAEELILKKLNREISDEEISKLKERFVKDLEEEYLSDKTQFKEIAGASEFYNTLLRSNEFQLGISTGGWEESANLKLKAIGINPYSVCYSNSNQFKTRKGITLDVINQLNSKTKREPNEIIYIGDGEWDLTTCNKLNIRFIGIDNQNNGKLKKAGALEIYKDFERPEVIMKSIRNMAVDNT